MQIYLKTYFQRAIYGAICEVGLYVSIYGSWIFQFPIRIPDSFKMLLLLKALLDHSEFLAPLRR